VVDDGPASGTRPILANVTDERVQAIAKELSRIEEAAMYSAQTPCVTPR
jgi:hypothetical protein